MWSAGLCGLSAIRISFRRKCHLAGPGPHQLPAGETEELLGPAETYPPRSERAGAWGGAAVQRITGFFSRVPRRRRAATGYAKAEASIDPLDRRIQNCSSLAWLRCTWCGPPLPT